MLTNRGYGGCRRRDMEAAEGGIPEITEGGIRRLPKKGYGVCRRRDTGDYRRSDTEVAEEGIWRLPKNGYGGCRRRSIETGERKSGWRGEAAERAGVGLRKGKWGGFWGGGGARDWSAEKGRV